MFPETLIVAGKTARCYYPQNHNLNRQLRRLLQSSQVTCCIFSFALIQRLDVVCYVWWSKASTTISTVRYQLGLTWMSGGLHSFQARSQNCQKQLLASPCFSVIPSICLSAWSKSAPTRPIFIKFDIWEFFRKSVEKIQVWLKFGNNNNEYFTWSPMYIDGTSLNYS